VVRRVFDGGPVNSKGGLTNFSDLRREQVQTQKMVYNFKK
jgi:hypothetical protein